MGLLIMTSEVNVKAELYKLISNHQPIGWYRLELKLPVQRKYFKEGYTLMTYLDEMIAEGEELNSQQMKNT